MKTIMIACPNSLADQLEALAREGYVADQQQASIDAIRRYIEAHRPELIESQIRADVQWGLRGED